MSGELHVVGMVQARMGSTRLPGKALALLGGRPLTAWICGRVAAARRVHRAVVVTTLDPGEAPLVEMAAAEGIGCFRGATDDIVARFADGACHFGADVVVRVWGDCPFVDPEVIDAIAGRVLDEGLDYGATFSPERKTFPAGVDVEVYRTSALRAIRAATDDPFFREFPFEHIRAHRREFATGEIHCEEDFSGHNLSIDYPEDLELARTIVERLGTGDGLGYRRIVALLRDDPLLEAPTRALRRNIEYAQKRKGRSP